MNLALISSIFGLSILYGKNVLRVIDYGGLAIVFTVVCVNSLLSGCILMLLLGLVTHSTLYLIPCFLAFCSYLSLLIF